MPYRRRYKRKKSKTAIKKKRIPRPLFINNFSNGFPTKLFCKLTFSDVITLSAITNVVDTHVLNLNSMFRPDVTGSSGQPRYYDELAQEKLYDVYLVTRCDYKITFVNKDSTDALVQVKLGNANTAIPVTSDPLWKFGETKYCRNHILTSVGTTHSKVTMSGSTTIWPLIANSKLNMMADRSSYQGKFDSSPAVLAQLRFSVSDDPTGASGCTVDVYYTLKFTAEFSNLTFDVDPS